MRQRRTISSNMSYTFCNVLPLKVAIFVSMIYIIYTSILHGYLLPYFIIYWLRQSENARSARLLLFDDDKVKMARKPGKKHDENQL